MSKPEIKLLSKALTGSCQCGAPVLREHLRWTTKPPNFFDSSSSAKHGFCAKCGTPLTFGYNQSKWMCVTTGSLDDPKKGVRPLFYPGLIWRGRSRAPCRIRTMSTFLGLAEGLGRKKMT